MDIVKFERARVVKNALLALKRSKEHIDFCKLSFPGLEIGALQFNGGYFFNILVKGNDDGLLKEIWELYQKKLAEKVEALQKEFDAL